MNSDDLTRDEKVGNDVSPTGVEEAKLSYCAIDFCQNFDLKDVATPPPDTYVPAHLHPACKE